MSLQELPGRSAPQEKNRFPYLEAFPTIWGKEIKKIK
jgi:hypothetical protein